MFRTELFPDHSPVGINLRDKILTIGSCFSDAIGRKFTVNKFDTAVNPFGIIYNPHSIHKSLLYAIHNQVVPEHGYVQNQEIHFHYDFHSRFSTLDKRELEKKLKETIGSVHYFLKDCKWLIITYGTAWVYPRNDTGDIVANCHKMPGNSFTKELYTQKKVLESFKVFYQDLKAFNPSLQIILTVSPVRHVKDTLELSSVSKAALRLSCHTLSELHDDVHYFPSFEIMIDDLRDYRFYKPDLIHPSEEAEEYIWSKFANAWLDRSAKEFVDRWKSVLQALNHKPFHPSTGAHQKFIRETISRLEELKSIVPVTQEIEQLRKQLV